MIATFARFANLYGTKAEARGLKVMEDEGRGIHSQEFLLWCRKCDGMKPEEFKRALDELEYRSEVAGREGLEAWPPSYAEFRGMARLSWETRAQRPQLPPVDVNAAHRIEHQLEPMTAEEFFEKWNR